MKDQSPVSIEQELPTILIVDDTPANIGVIAGMLDEHGYRVLVAQDGEEGLKRADFAQPDLILLDVMMPGIDGFEVCRILKKQTATRDIPVIFMTARAETADIVSGFRVGAVDYVIKPLQVDEVLARIETQLKLSSMQKRLEIQNEQLQRHREQLEQRVAERTAELYESNQNLQEETQKLRHTQERLTLVDFALNQTHEAVYLSDEEYHFIYVNAEASRLMGYSQQELLSMSIFDIDPDANPEELGQVKQVAELSGSLTFERRHKTKDGRIFPVEISGTIFKYQEKELIVSMVRDITERKRIEKELIQRESELRSLMESSPDTVIRYDLEGRIAYLNTKLRSLLNVSDIEVIGKKPHEAWPDGRFDELERTVLRVQETKKEARIEIRRNSGEEIRFQEVRVAPEWNDAREVVGVIAFGRDITELRRYEHEIEESRIQLRGLAARNEAVREEERKYIAREVHDELGQILTGLQLDVSMLSYKFPPGFPALHEHLQGTLELVNKSLAVARNVASALRPGSLDMGIVPAIEWLVERFGNNTGIKCAIHVHDEDRNIELDENSSIALFRITQESLTNISRHAKASKVDITFCQEKDDYLLEVRDNGIGFDVDMHKKESFGLMGIRERVYLLGGELTISSTPGSGTMIEVRMQVNNLAEEK